MLFWSRSQRGIAPAWPPHGEIVTVPLALPEGSVDVAGVALEAGDAAEVLAGARAAATDPYDPDAGEPSHMSASLATWGVASRALLALIARGRFVPVAEGADSAHELVLRWAAQLEQPADRRRRLVLVRALPPVAHCTGVSAAESLDAFWADATDSLVRRAAPAVQTPPGWETDFVEHLGTPPGYAWHAGSAAVAAEVLAWLPQPEYSETWVGIAILVPPSGPGGAWHLTYLVQSQEDPANRVASADVVESGTPAQRKALQAVLDATARWRRPGQPDDGSGDSLSPEDTWSYLQALGAPSDEARLTAPAGLTPGSRTARERLRLRLRAGSADSSGSSGSSGPAGLGDGAAPAQGLLAALSAEKLAWEVTVDGEALTPEAVTALREARLPLVRVADRWVALDEVELLRIQQALDAGPPKLGPGEVVAAVLAGELGLDEALTVDVVADGAVARVARALRGRELEERLAPPGLEGTLRPYQAKGLDWLVWLGSQALGGCLADDMGLGKTVEAIALMLEDPGTSLVVCPTSVLGNWERELRRFAPSLRPLRHYGPQRAETPEELVELVGPTTTVLTTYAIVRRDAELLAGVDWHRVVLDEAQHVKNPASDTARAARSIGARARHRLALTGTPVENNLTELWSILDFCNPGLLGPEQSFRRRFVVPIERYGDTPSADRLRRITAPFVLRRKKSDPLIVPDLPEKHETTLFCNLTPEQAVLYQATLDETLERISGADGMSRRGLILAMLTRLKQVCDHPSLVLDASGGPGRRGAVEERSGKLAHLLDVIEDVREAGDKSLVFTQYVQMGEILSSTLGNAPFLHGGLRQAQRDQLVEAFQGPGGPEVLVVSLRAGGLGLNLTAATRVFHYDRWWNPAVEDQATDRAHRIGQTRDVWVHRLVCLGTLEERVDAMLERKRDLADRVVGEGGSWLTELDDTELAALVALEEGAAL